jgi:membrane fusion protein (multidrug efflux system)
VIRPLIIVVTALAVVFGSIFGWKAYQSWQTQQARASAKPPAVTVSSGEVAQERWEVRVDSVGGLRAIQGVDVSPEVPGSVAAISFQSGHQVERGALLVQLDASAEKAELRAVAAQLELARLDYERARGLQERTALSQAQLDRAKSVMDSLAAEAEEQQALIARKSIRAPFSGELGIRQVNVGDYLSPGAEIVTLQKLDPIYVDFTVPERHLRTLAVDQVIEIEVAAYPGETFAGRVTAISPRVEEKTRNVILQGTLVNVGLQLRPGMFARVSVLVGAVDEVLTLPRSAISFYPYGESVFLVLTRDDDLVVERRQVTTGRIRAGRVEVVSGLAIGEKVVSAGQLKLRNGQRIRIDNSVQLPTGLGKG